MARVVMAALVLLLVVPQAAAQFNGPRGFAADYDFSDPATDSFTTVLSGRLGASLAGSGGPYGFFDASGFAMSGVHQVCTGPPGQAPQCQSGAYTVVVEDGGSIGISFPGNAEGRYEADHAIGMFLRQRGDDLNSLSLNESLMVPAVHGRMNFTGIHTIPAFLTGLAGFASPRGVLAPTTPETVVRVLDAEGATVVGLAGKDEVMYFSGPVAVAAFASDFAVLPFRHGSEAVFTPAPSQAAREGLDFQRLQSLMDQLQQASRDREDGGGAGDVGSSPLQEALSEVLNAAVLRFPNGNATADQVREGFALVLYDQVRVQNQDGALAWSGMAAFQFQQGEVQGAQELHGFWLIQLPWWGWLLWMAAIGVLVARLAVKPEQKHDRWQQYRWVGWLASFVLLVLVFFLWDLEMRSVWGTSVMTTQTSGTAFFITLALQLGTMALVIGAVAWPLSIIIKNTLLLVGQGTFMGLGKPTSLLLAYLLGATLFLAYLELILQRVMENLPSG